jgi:hypothetical protein
MCLGIHFEALGEPWKEDSVNMNQSERAMARIKFILTIVNGQLSMPHPLTSPFLTDSPGYKAQVIANIVKLLMLYFLLVLILL